jgi:hypothetical protein
MATQITALFKDAGQAIEEGRFATALDVIRKVRTLPGYERSPMSVEMQIKLLPHCPKVTLRGGWLVRTFTGHKGMVKSVSLSADGRLALSGANETARLWEVDTGRCLHIFEGHRNEVGSVSLSADGHLALSGSIDGVKVWNVATGRYQSTFEGHSAGITCVSVSPDGRVALSGSYDETLQLWEVATGRYLRIFERDGQKQLVPSVGMSADGRFAISAGSLDKTVPLWEVATGRCLRTFQGHTNIVFFVSLSADGHLALCADLDKTVRLWEVATGRCLRTFQIAFDQLSLSADGRWILSTSDGNIQVWEVASGRCLRTFQMDSGVVISASLSTDGRWILSGSLDGPLDLWELDWELESHDPADWDAGAQPYLEIFLTQHVPYAGVLPQGREPSEQEIQQALTRRGRPSWTEQDFQELIRQLQYAGYGWLRPEGVRNKLEELAASWQGPPLLPGESFSWHNLEEAILDRTEGYHQVIETLKTYMQKTEEERCQKAITVQGASTLRQRYRVLHPFKNTSFATFYTAEDIQFNNRPVIVKTPLVETLSPQQIVEETNRFVHEAFMLSLLSHPQIPRLCDVFVENEHWYYIIDFIEGDTLLAYLDQARDKCLPTDEVIRIGIQLCTVLNYLHTCQPPIIFRDLKPKSIMRTPDENFYLFDFKIARYFKPGQAKDTIALGAPGYAAPEQYGKAQTTPRSDIYSLGVTLHQLLTGRDPAEAPFWFAPFEHQPVQLKELIFQMLEVSSDKRPESMAVIRSRLQQIARG